MCENVMAGLPDRSVDCIVTDPPYAVNYAHGSYNDSEADVLAAMPSWFAEFSRLMKDDSFVFMFVGVRHIEKWIVCAEQNGFTFKNIIATRAFNNGSKLKNNFAFVMQPVLLFSKGRGRRFNDVNFFPTSEAWLNDSRNERKTPYTYQYPNFVPVDVAYGTAVYGSDSPKKRCVHPNEKSEPLCRFFIEIATDVGGVVLDPFMGIGTVGVASMNAQRSFIGIEQDLRYFNEARLRIEGANPLFAS